MQLPEESEPNDQNQTLLITIGVVLAAVVILLLFMITFFKIKFVSINNAYHLSIIIIYACPLKRLVEINQKLCSQERRRFGDEKIKRFFNGIGGPQQVPYNNLDEPDSIDSVSYDTSREINFNSLNFGANKL